MSKHKDIKIKYFLWSIALLVFSLFCVSHFAAADTFIWQDFEYWDSPRNHGWTCSSPAYPVWGPSPFVGYGNIRTAIDHRLQSRVLKLESPPSPFNQFFRYRALNQSVPDPDPDTDGFDKNVISFNIVNLFGIEQFDQWEVQLQVVSRDGRNILLVYRPRGESASGPEVGGTAEYGYMDQINGGDPDNPENPLVVIYNLGRQYQDGGWHLVVRDLDQDIREIGTWDGIDFSMDGFGKEFIFSPKDSEIRYIMFIGFSVMVDNIAFHDKLSEIINHPPKLQRIGPQFAELFVPYSFIITAKDIDQPPLTASPGDDKLEFFATIGGYGYQGVQTTDMIFRIKEDPNGNYVICDNNDSARLPNKVLLQFTPQVFEDLIVTIRVVDEGGLSDIETFPLSVVNYPITNRPPYLEEIENDVYILGSNDGYFIKEFICYDHDKEDDPGTVEDAGNITYRVRIDGQSAYQYGPWREPLIPRPFKPEIRFSPKFEGAHKILVMATDQRGLSAITEFTLIVVNSGTWLNHPPILCEDIDSPQVAKAGATFVIPVEFFDPDEDQIYYSCNVGSITEMGEDLGITQDSTIGQTSDKDKYGRYVSGAVYTFTSHWPGTHLIEIIAYDIRGGYSVLEFILDVQPWWTY